VIFGRLGGAPRPEHRKPHVRQDGSVRTEIQVSAVKGRRRPEKRNYGFERAKGVQPHSPIFSIFGEMGRLVPNLFR